MESKTIEQGNKLIMKFMGDMTDDCEEWVNSDKRLVGNLEYHSSWDWLMPVVKKISKLPMIKGKVLEQTNNYEHLITGLETLDIKELWHRVVYYIEWFNTQSK